MRGVKFECKYKEEVTLKADYTFSKFMEESVAVNRKARARYFVSAINFETIDHFIILRRRPLIY